MLNLFFSETNMTPMSIYVPISKPMGYNSTQNPIQIHLNLDPNCRYKIRLVQKLLRKIKNI